MKRTLAYLIIFISISAFSQDHDDIVRSLLKKCKKGYMTITDLTVEDREGHRFLIPFQEIFYREY